MAITLPFHDKLMGLTTTWHDECVPWYTALQPREQIILKVAAVLLPCIIIIFGVFLPLQEKKSALQTHVIALAGQAHEAEQLATQLQQQGAKNKPQAATGSLLSQMDALASKQGVRQYVTQMRPQSGMDGKQRLRLMMKKIPYAQAVRFLLAIDQAYLRVQKMKIQKDTSSGYVQLQLLLAKVE